MAKRLEHTPGILTSQDIWQAVNEFADIEHSGLILTDEKAAPMAVIFKAAQLHAEALEVVERTSKQN